MAKFTASIYFPDLVGSIGGLTIQNNLSGPTIRIKPKPPKSRTAEQTNEILLFSNLSQQYTQITRPEKILWDVFAAANPHVTLWNETRTISGANYFLLMNYYLILIGQPTITTPPVYIAPIACAAFTLAIGNNFMQAATAGLFGAPGLSMISVFTTPIKSDTLLPRKLFLLKPTILPANIGGFDNVTDWEAKTGLNNVTNVVNANNTIRLGISLVDPACPIPSPFVFNS